MCRRKILIEASEIMMDSHDGCQRYVKELLRGLWSVAAEEGGEWEIDVHLGLGIIYNILDIGELLGINSSEAITPPVSQPKSYRRLQFLGILLRSWSFIINRFIKAMLSEEMFSFLQALNRSRQRWLHTHSTPDDVKHYDLVHVTLPQFYNTMAHQQSPFITTVHDLSHRHYPQFHRKDNIVSSEKGMAFSLARHSAFIAVSGSTRQDLLTTYPEIHPEDVHTVYEASDPEIFYQISDQDRLKELRRKYHIPDTPYFLTLSTLEPRKNLTNTIRAFLLLTKEQPELEINMVIAGKKGWKYQELFTEPSLQSDQIIFTGFIAEEDLAALYSGALALSYVSYYEGFGLPLLEAMSCGTPVIYGDNSSMPEVVGEAGLPADPDDIEDIKTTWQQLIQNEDLRATLARRALQQAGRFSWKKSIQGTLDAYKKTLGSAQKHNISF